MPDRNDPSMEDILASIKKVIAEEKTLRTPGSSLASRTDAGTMDGPEADDVLELEEAMVAGPAIEETVVEMRLPEPDLGPPLVSTDAADASRERLVELQAIAAAAPPPPSVNPLEAMLREMLRPVLKDWLDQHLPGIVDEHVRREIARITGQTL